MKSQVITICGNFKQLPWILCSSALESKNRISKLHVTNLFDLKKKKGLWSMSNRAVLYLLNSGKKFLILSLVEERLKIRNASWKRVHGGTWYGDTSSSPLLMEFYQVLGSTFLDSLKASVILLFVHFFMPHLFFTISINMLPYSTVSVGSLKSNTLNYTYTWYLWCFNSNLFKTEI